MNNKDLFMINMELSKLINIFNKIKKNNNTFKDNMKNFREKKI